MEVELIKSDANRIVISGKNHEDVLVNNKNGTLKIKMKFEEAFDGNKTKIQLYYTAVDVIDVNEGARVFSEGTIKQFEIDLKCTRRWKNRIKSRCKLCKYQIGYRF